MGFIESPIVEYVKESSGWKPYGHPGGYKNEKGKFISTSYNALPDRHGNDPELVEGYVHNDSLYVPKAIGYKPPVLSSSVQKDLMGISYVAIGDEWVEIDDLDMNEVQGRVIEAIKNYDQPDRKIFLTRLAKKLGVGLDG